MISTNLGIPGCFISMHFGHQNISDTFQILNSKSKSKKNGTVSNDPQIFAKLYTYILCPSRKLSFSISWYALLNNSGALTR